MIARVTFRASGVYRWILQDMLYVWYNIQNKSLLNPANRCSYIVFALGLARYNIAVLSLMPRPWVARGGRLGSRIYHVVGFFFFFSQPTYGKQIIYEIIVQTTNRLQSGT